MEFGNSIFLWALAAVPLPILLHLFFKRRKHKIMFSTLMFLVKKERYFAYRKKLFELLLLALRALAVFVLVLALSRMFFKKYYFLSGAATDVVLILDDTPSMQRKLPSGTTAFDVARKKAESVLDSLAGDDGAAVIFMSGRDGINLTRDKTKVLKCLRKATVCGVAATLAPAVEVAAEQLRKAPGVNREIYIISDFQKKLKPTDALDISSLKNTRVYCLPLQGGSDNFSVDSIVIDSTPKIVHKTMTIPFRVVNHSNNDEDIFARLVIGRQAIQSQTLSVKARSSQTGRFLYVPDRSGRLNGYIEIDDANGFAVDNRAYFSVAISSMIKVLFVKDKDTHVDPFFFFRFALDPASDHHAYGIDTDMALIENIGLADLKKGHMVFCSIASDLGHEKAQVLREYLAEGGVLVTVPQKDNTKQTYAALLTEKNPYGALVAFKKNGVSFNQPLNELNELLQLDLVQWKKLFKFNIKDRAKVLAHVNNTPVIIEQKQKKGRLLNLAFDLRRNFSNWPVLKSFPVMSVAFVKYAVGHTENSVKKLCGMSVRLKGKNIKYSSSSSQGRLKSLAGNVLFSDTFLPGVVTFDNADTEAAVINIDPEESKPEIVDDKIIHQFFNSSVTILDTGTGISQQVVMLRKGMELSGILLFVGLFLIVLEFILGCNRDMLKQFFSKTEVRGK